MNTALADRPTISGDQWFCACGRANANGVTLCPGCGRVPPRGAKAVVDDRPDGRAPSLPGVRGVRLAVGVIFLNIVLQAVTLVMVSTGRMETSTAIALATWLGVGFYGVVLAMITGPLLLLRPNWLRGDPRTARLFGAEVGFASALFVIAIAWAAAGHPVVDPSADILVSEGSLLHIVVALVVIAVIAPVVEELLFRGVVAESLRRRGPAVAIFVSSLLFALAHLRGLGYYTVCGVVLGVLYWRRGLWASIAAHATFNASLVMLAVVVAHGPSHVLVADGVSVRAPADWKLADAAAMPPGAQLGIKGPSGSSMLVERHQLPGRRAVDLQGLAGAVNSGRIPPPPNTTIGSGGAHVTAYPAGSAVEVPVTVLGHSGVVVLLPRGSELWEIDVATAGSPRALREYPKILQSMTLPPAG